MEIISFLHHLLPATKFLHVLWIIIVVVNGCHCTELIKAPCQHTLWVHICETKWTYNRGHALLFAVVFNSLQQSIWHFDIVNEVYPTEANILLFPFFVCLMINDGSYTPHHFPLLQGEEILSFAEVKSSILVSWQRIQLIAIEVWGIIRIALVEIIMKLYESL